MHIKFFLVICFLFQLDHHFRIDLDMKKQFDDYTKRYNKSYTSPDEYNYRFKIFVSNFELIKKTNAMKYEWVMGLNKFYDVTEDEFAKFYLLPEKVLYNFKDSADFESKTGVQDIIEKKLHQIFSPEAKANIGFAKSPSAPVKRLLQYSAQRGSLPRRVDWRAKGVITPVKDQKDCNACYAFSSIAAVEAWYAILYGKLVNLSEQEILDCSSENVNCVGGKMTAVMQYIIRNKINYTQNYPYLGTKNRCQRNPNRTMFQSLKGFSKLNRDILSLLQMVAEGPVSAAHYAPNILKNYNSGIYTGQGCEGNVSRVNHSALIVGYNLDAPIPYFELKNSWSDDWGENGYYRIAIGPINSYSEGLCQIAGTGFNVIPIFW